MILEHLIQYYEGNTASLPSFKFEYKEISFVILLNKEGSLLDILDMRRANGEGEKMLVPQSVKRSGTGCCPNCLWDNLKYVFGIGSYKNAKQKKSLEEKRISFLNKLKEFSGAVKENTEIEAVIRFLEGDFLKTLEKHALWKEMVNLNVYVSFSIESAHRLVCQEDSVVQALSTFSEDDPEETTSFCLLTGKVGPIARLHPTIHGVYGAQGSGASLISYNLDAVESFGKEQGYNAPISKMAAFAYSAALNHLLETPQKVAFNQTMTVLFWSQKKTSFEGVFSEFLKSSSKEASTSFLLGCIETEEDSLPFYVHGLSPNGGRLSIRFSWVGSIGDLKKRMIKHSKDLELMSVSKDQELYSIFSLLYAFSPCRDIKHVQPRLAGEFLFSILNDGAYPQNLLSILLERFSDEEGISHRRVALLKAWMNRRSNAVKISPSLNLFNQNVSYLLGRLFAVLELARKKYRKKREAPSSYSLYKIASISPKRIFPYLLSRHEIHLTSLPSSYIEYFQRTKKTIMGSFEEFPSNLSLVDQGEFAMGYYQQKQQMLLEIKKM